MFLAILSGLFSVESAKETGLLLPVSRTCFVKGRSVGNELGLAYLPLLTSQLSASWSTLSASLAFRCDCMVNSDQQNITGNVKAHFLV